MKRIIYSTLTILLFSFNFALAQEGGTIILSETEYQELLRKSQNSTCTAATEAAKEKRIRKSKRGISLRLGGGLNYMYGTDTKGNENFNTDYASWYGKAMLGYVSNYDQQGLGTTLGAFLTVGNTSENSIQHFLDEGLTGETSNPASENLYYQLELGAVLFQSLRISTGAGYQEFKNAANTEQKIRYYSTTGGLQLGGRYTKLTIDVNFMYGRDLDETVLRPMIGFVFQL